MFRFEPFREHGIPFLYGDSLVEIKHERPSLHTLIIRVLPVKKILWLPTVVRVTQHDRRSLHHRYIAAYSPAGNRFPAGDSLYDAHILKIPPVALRTVHKPLPGHGIRSTKLFITPAGKLAHLDIKYLVLSEHVLKHPVDNTLPVCSRTLQYQEILKAYIASVDKTGPKKHL